VTEVGIRTEEELLLRAAEAYGWTAPRDEPFTYLVARMEAEDNGLVAGLERRGFAVIRLRLLGTEPGRDMAALAARLEALPSDTALAWTSRRAAAALAQVAMSGHRARLERAALFALGEASAGPLAEQGLSVRVPPGPAAGAAALARFVAKAAAGGAFRRVLYLAGNRSLPDFEEGLAASGLETERLEVYATCALRPDTRDVRKALEARRLACAVFFSPSAAEALVALLDPGTLALLRRVPVAAKGPTTAAGVRARGFRSVDGGLRTILPRRSHPLAFLALHLMGETA
jgi:uroporphyrinogen-III synthase